MMPHEVARRQTQPHTIEIDLWLDPAMFWFRGHFAVQPLLPGVAQVEWAIRYGIELLAPGYRFHSMPNVKFQAPQLPESMVTLTLTWQPERETLSFRYQRHDGDARHTASSGKIRLCQ